MQEYNAIEQQTKANGTWMKNSDGSSFQGTPEQFVQQNSENFKKAFGNSIVRDSNNNIIKMYHGSPNTNIQEFLSPKRNNNFVKRTQTTKNTEHVYVTHDINTAERYAKKDFRYEFPDINKGKVYELYANVENPLITKNYGKIAQPELNKESLAFDGITNLEFGKNYKPYTFGELAIPDNNYLKSAIGNNGMFDMTNPNIYKGLIPAAGLYGLNKDNKLYKPGNKTIVSNVVSN